MKRGFNLLELVIVLIIVGVLATIALPSYTRSREQALGGEALSDLRLIAAAEKIYRMEIGTFWPSTGNDTSWTSINTNLKLYLTNTNWNWSITGGTTAFTAYGDRKGSGGYADCVYSITQGGTETSTNCP
jgi:prepilin-type N-terminal cleavage/methylation domain-containing protein